MSLKIRDALMRGMSYSNENMSPQMDLSKGMLHGHNPEFGNYVSNTGHRPSPIIPFLWEAPRGFDFLPNPEKARSVLKQLMETQAKNITGLRTGYNVEASDRQVTHAGHMHSDPTKVTEEMSVVNYVWDERLYKPIQTFWMHYIRNLIADPVTTQPWYHELRLWTTYRQLSRHALVYYVVCRTRSIKALCGRGVAYKRHVAYHLRRTRITVRPYSRC